MHLLVVVVQLVLLLASTTTFGCNGQQTTKEIVISHDVFHDMTNNLGFSSNKISKEFPTTNKTESENENNFEEILQKQLQIEEDERQQQQQQHPNQQQDLKVQQQQQHKLLSRKRRYLLFPEGSSFQLGKCSK